MNGNDKIKAMLKIRNAHQQLQDILEDVGKLLRRLETANRALYEVAETIWPDEFKSTGKPEPDTEN